MKYLSTKQAAELWGISPRRVVLLASKGRIPGAVLMDNRWLIPDGVEKPSDSRRREFRNQAGNESVLPNIFVFVRTLEGMEAFSDAERALYRVSLLTEDGRFQEARELAEETVSSTQNRYIRFAALYLLTFTCLLSCDFASADRYALLFRTAYHDFDEPGPELEYFYDIFNSEMDGFAGLLSDLSMESCMRCSDGFLPATSYLKLLKDMTNMSLYGVMPDICSDEIMLRLVEAQGYYYFPMLMHIYVSAMCAAAGEYDRESEHLRAALDLAVNHGTYLSASAALLWCNTETVSSLLLEYPQEIRDKFKELSFIFSDSKVRYQVCHSGVSSLSGLTEKDYYLISCCLKEYSIEKMSRIMNISQPAVKKRLASLYSKLGVKNKKELVSVYAGAIISWCRTDEV